MNFANSLKALKSHAYFYQFGKIYFSMDGVDTRLSPSAIIFLSQLIYWQGKEQFPEKGVYKTKAAWEDELGISSRRIDTARAELIKAGLISETQEEYPVKIYYKLNISVLESYLDKLAEKGFVSIECEAEPVKPVAKPIDKDIPEGWEPSENLITFKNAIYERTTDYAVSNFYNADGTPIKYWYFVDGYIDALLRGEFVARFGKHFTKPVKELPPLSLPEIIDTAVATKILKSKGKPNINDIFWVYGGKFSRFVNKYYQNKPCLVDLNPSDIAKYREIYSFIEDKDTDSYSVLQYASKVKGLTERMDYCYYITDKIYSFYDDSTMASLKNVGKEMAIGQRKSFTKFWVAAFIDYNERMKKFKKESKWATFDEWIAATKVGDSHAMTPWYVVMEYVYRMRGWCMTENKTAFASIKKYVETAKARLNGGY